jgi:hypothetical protein
VSDAPGRKWDILINFSTMIPQTHYNMYNDRRLLCQDRWCQKYLEICVLRNISTII